MDELFDKLDKIAFEISTYNKTVKEIEEEKLEENFNLRIEEYFNDKKAQELIGKYNEYALNSDERLINFSKFLDECVAKTKAGEFKDGDKLYMTNRHAKNLKDEASKMFSFNEKIMLKSASDSFNKADMQAYLNERSIGARGENKESTMQGIKTKIQKINLLENLAKGERNNYSSNLRTPEELREFKNLKNTKPKNNKDSNKNKGMSEEDYAKIFNPLFEKLTTNPASVTEAEAAFLLAGEFGLRPSTILKINLGQVNIKDCGIEVEKEDNKSKQMFIAKTSAVEPVNTITQQILSGLYQRALLVYKPDKDENIRLVNCCEQNLHKGYTSILRRYGVNPGKYEGKYKNLRHMFAQRVYTEYRQTYIDTPGKTNIQKQAAALREVNYLMGHEAKKTKATTMGYIKNLW